MSPIIFTVGSFEVRWYSVLIAISVLISYSMIIREGERLNIKKEFTFNMLFWTLIFGIIGARLYYVLFNLSYYSHNVAEIFKIWNGGLAITGGTIAGLITILLYCKKYKVNSLKVLDIIVVALLLSQAIGRWGNFFNREAFGDYTDGLLAMRLPLDAVRIGEVTEKMMSHSVTEEGITYIQVHPTFLYESLWNLGVLAVLLILTLKGISKFQGEIFLFYLMLYGLGRLWIEGLRTDQLLIPGTRLPVSQVLSGALVLAALILMIRNIYTRREASPRRR